MVNELQNSDNEDKENCLLVAREYLATFREFIASHQTGAVENESSSTSSAPLTGILLDDWTSRVKNHLGKIERKLDTLDGALEELKPFIGTPTYLYGVVQELIDELAIMCDEVITYLTVNNDPQIRNEFGKLERERQILLQDWQKIMERNKPVEPAPKSKTTAPIDTLLETSASEKVNTVEAVQKQILLLQNLEEKLHGGLSKIVIIEPQMQKGMLLFCIEPINSHYSTKCRNRKTKRFRHIAEIGARRLRR